MKITLFYLTVFLTGILVFVSLISSAPSPETVILGEWKEMKWEYEKVNKSENKDYSSLETQEQAGQHLIIHQAENWTFLPGGKLKLSGKKNDKIVSWRIKGRGHILELKYDNNTKEHYNLTRLDGDKMVLNFESDMQVRGIAKLTFEKLL
jgi:hypothetical protein